MGITIMGFAILDFAGRSISNRNINCTYYEFPSWGSDTPDEMMLKSHQLYKEIIAYQRQPSPPKPKEPIRAGDDIFLVNQAGKYISTCETGGWPTYYNYPTCNARKLKLTVEFVQEGRNGKLKSGDDVRILSPELGNEYALGAWKDRSALYFYNKNYDVKKQGWRFVKLDQSDDSIKYGDKIYIYNNYWNEQKMCQDLNWLTTRAGSGDVWTIIKATRYKINIRKKK